MKIRKNILLILGLLLVLVACSKDDKVTAIEIRDRAEQQIADNDSIVQYLETHYYNATQVNDALPDFNSLDDIVFTKLEDGETVPDGHVLLKDAVETKTCVYADTDYTYYILKLNQGGGNDSPTFADDILVTYEGSLLNTGSVFDSAVNPINLDLTTLVPGWRKVFPFFNTASSYNENTDGTVSYSDPGLGVMFIPSGLAYFSNPIYGVSYAPLIFKFQLLQTTQNDHDGDGVPSYLEDLNGDGEFTVDFKESTDDTDDDTDDDNFPDYNDTDDDGDGVLTKYEDLDGDGDPTNDDSDGDGIPNYLDKDSTASNK